MSTGSTVPVQPTGQAPRKGIEGDLWRLILVLRVRPREVRGWLAVLVAILFVFVTGTLLRSWGLVNDADKNVATIWIVYGAVSLLVVTLVLLFGVGSWSRYLPEDSERELAALLRRVRKEDQ